MSKQIVTVGKRRKYNKDSLTWVAGKGWQGVVYIYRLDAPGDEKDGWVYVGCTPEEETRKNRWNFQHFQQMPLRFAEVVRRTVKDDTIGGIVKVIVTTANTLVACF